MADSEVRVERPRLRRIERPISVTLVAVAVVTAVGGAFAIGRFTTPPTRDAVIAAQDAIPVIVAVEERVVDAGVTFAASVDAGDLIDVRVEPGVAPAIVVRRTLSVDDVVTPGQLVGVVSGVPFFALPGPLPLFRDLARGDRGDDVVALQRSLAASGFALEATGIVDSATLGHVRSMFEASGFTLPWAAPIPFRQLLPLPGSPAVVTDAAEVGARVEGEPLLSIRVGEPRITFLADVVTAGDLTVGDPVTIRGAGTVFEGAVAEIGDYSDGSDGNPPGRRITIASEAEAFGALPHEAPVTVSLAFAENEPTTAIPITALRRDADGDYVELAETRDGVLTFTRVPVSVLFTGGGWVAIAPNQGLAIGDRIRAA